MCVVIKGEMQDNLDKENKCDLRMKYRIPENTKKKSGQWFVCFTVKTKEQSMAINIKKQLWKSYKERT